MNRDRVATEFATFVDAAAALSSASRVVVATGAGMSADSGVPTYRDADGRWRDFEAFTRHGIQPKDIAHLDGYQRDPHLAWAFHEHMRRLIAGSEPHPGYPVITRLLERLGEDAFLLTSNIDEMHLRAGVRRRQMWARYGSLWELQCVAACRDTWWRDARPETTELDPASMRARDVPRCPFCDGPARPRVQLDHDPHFIQDDVGAARYERFVAEPVDCYLIIGTTLWFSWPGDVPAPRVLHVNPNPETHLRYDDPIALTMGARDALVGLELALERLLSGG